MDFTFSTLTLGLAGEGLGLFLTSIQDSESRSGRLAERPLGIVLRFDTSESVLVFCFIGVETIGEPTADTVIGLHIKKKNIYECMQHVRIRCADCINHDKSIHTAPVPKKLKKNTTAAAWELLDSGTPTVNRKKCFAKLATLRSRPVSVN